MQANTPDNIYTLEAAATHPKLRNCGFTMRTLRYYALLGLLPAPLKPSPANGDARVHYFDESLINRLCQIKALKAEGFSLKQIRKQLDAEPLMALDDSQVSDLEANRLPRLPRPSQPRLETLQPSLDLLKDQLRSMNLDGQDRAKLAQQWLLDSLSAVGSAGPNQSIEKIAQIEAYLLRCLQR